jgi:hypothetical protein
MLATVVLKLVFSSMIMTTCDERGTADVGVGDGFGDPDGVGLADGDGFGVGDGLLTGVGDALGSLSVPDPPHPATKNKR